MHIAVCMYLAEGAHVTSLPIAINAPSGVEGGHYESTAGPPSGGYTPRRTHPRAGVTRFM